MKNNTKKEKLVKSCTVFLCLLLTGCGTIGLAQEAAFESSYDNTVEEEVDIYTSQISGNTSHSRSSGIRSSRSQP